MRAHSIGRKWAIEKSNIRGTLLLLSQMTFLLLKHIFNVTWYTFVNCGLICGRYDGLGSLGSHIHPPGHLLCVERVRGSWYSVCHGLHIVELLERKNGFTCAPFTAILVCIYTRHATPKSLNNAHNHSLLNVNMHNLHFGKLCYLSIIKV